MNENALIESSEIRTKVMITHTDEQALDLLNKAKALVMAMWQGLGRATSEEIAAYYEVPVTTVNSAVTRNADELKSDGLVTVKGEELKEVKGTMRFTSSASSLTLHTPRSAVRLGMILRDSAVAKQVRTEILNIVGTPPGIQQPGGEDFAGVFDQILADSQMLYQQAQALHLLHSKHKVLESQQARLEAEQQKLVEGQQQLERSQGQQAVEQTKLHSILDSQSLSLVQIKTLLKDSLDVESIPRNVRGDLEHLVALLGKMLFCKNKEETTPISFIYARIWKAISNKMRFAAATNSSLNQRYCLEARYKNAQQRYKADHKVWKETPKKIRGLAPTKLSRLDILERDGMLRTAFIAAQMVAHDMLPDIDIA